MEPGLQETPFTKEHKEHLERFSKKAEAHKLRQQMRESIRVHPIEATITKLPSCIEAMIPNSKVTLESNDCTSEDSSTIQP
jgi:hypothetical protein